MIYSVEPFLTILKYTNHKIQPNYYVAAAGPEQVHVRVRWIRSDIEREELHLMRKTRRKLGGTHSCLATWISRMSAVMDGVEARV